MVDRQERQRMGEIAEWEGGETEEGQVAPSREREGARADTPRPDDGRSAGFARSGSGKSIERAARKEVRWSKDVDYEG